MQLNAKWTLPLMLATALGVAPLLGSACAGGAGEGEGEGEGAAAGEGEGAGAGEGEGEGGGETQALSDALSAYLDRCGGSALGFGATEEPTAAGVEVDLLKASIETGLAAEASNANQTFHADVAASCTAHITAAQCDDGLFVGVLGDAACAGLFTGNLAIGAQCPDAGDCAAGSSCEGNSDTDCGVCTADVTTVGGDCTDAECAAPLACDFNDDTCQTPAALPGIGDPCPDFDCADENAQCDTSQATATCVAVTVAAVGDPCNAVSEHCIDSETKNFCDTPNGSTCVARAALGAACSLSLPCDATTSFCDTANTNTCIATVAEGGVCDPDVGGQCEFGTLCDDTAHTCKSFITPTATPTCH